MKTKHLLFPAALVLLLNTASAATSATASDSTSTELVARGRHLVEDVALCSDCHGPRLPSGELDRTQWLQGAPIGFQPLVKMPWAPVAPPLAGAAAYTDSHLVTLLTTGLRADGTAPLPPMPAFKLTVDEARAVVTYLRSLAPTP